MSCIVCMNLIYWSKTIVIHLKSSQIFQHQLTNLQTKHLIKLQNTIQKKQSVCWIQCTHVTNISYSSFLYTNYWPQMQLAAPTLQICNTGYADKQTVLHYFQRTCIQVTLQLCHYKTIFLKLRFRVLLMCLPI